MRNLLALGLLLQWSPLLVNALPTPDYTATVLEGHGYFAAVPMSFSEHHTLIASTSTAQHIVWRVKNQSRFFGISGLPRRCPSASHLIHESRLAKLEPGTSRRAQGSSHTRAARATRAGY
ncbi:hypothetical protein DFH06DRAFT_1298065 [Mycena polygramma]|nr:hypothetical protein DFH06DRAFT_1298065 [Mycena polygramma]